jgi:hypothetical protein
MGETLSTEVIIIVMLHGYAIRIMCMQSEFRDLFCDPGGIYLLVYMCVRFALIDVRHTCASLP